MAAKRTRTKSSTPDPKVEEKGEGSKGRNPKRLKLGSDQSGQSDLASVSMSKIPTSKHPSVEGLEELSFDLLPPGFFVIVYGARRTGKTHAVENLLEQIKDRFDFAYLFSNTAELHKGSDEFCNFDTIRDEAKFDGFDEETLLRIIERQKSVMKFNNGCKYKRDKKPNKTLLIFDDFVHDHNVRYNKTFTELPVLGRHMEISCICLSQGYSSVGSGGLNKATRMNADLVMTFLPRSLDDLERIAEWYLTKEKVENMWFVKGVCQEEHQCVAVDLTLPHLTEFDEYCYKYKAGPDIPKYELGKIQWRLFHEERKRAKKAALGEALDNERAFHLTLGDIEKRGRIGEATGLPDRAGSKPSMFEAFSLLG